MLISWNIKGEYHPYKAILLHHIKKRDKGIIFDKKNHKYISLEEAKKNKIKYSKNDIRNPLENYKKLYPDYIKIDSNNNRTPIIPKELLNHYNGKKVLPSEKFDLKFNDLLKGVVVSPENLIKYPYLKANDIYENQKVDELLDKPLSFSNKKTYSSEKRTKKFLEHAAANPDVVGVYLDKKTNRWKCYMYGDKPRIEKLYSHKFLLKAKWYEDDNKSTKQENKPKITEGICSYALATIGIGVICYASYKGLNYLYNYLFSNQTEKNSDKKSELGILTNNNIG